MSGLAETWTLIDQAVYSSLVIAAVCGFLGVFVHLRRVIFVGVALSQAAACGVGLAFFAQTAAWTAAAPLAILRHPTAMSVLLQSGAAVLLAAARDRHRITREAVIGIVFCAAGALSVLFVAGSASGMDEVKTLVSGEILGATWRDTILLLVVLGPVTLLQLGCLNRFLLVAFDHEMAETLGIRTAAWDVLFYLSLGVAISLAIRTTGTLFVFAYLLLPPAAALFLVRRVGALLALSALLGAGANFAGLWISVQWDLPAGPCAVMTAAATFLAAFTAHSVRSRLSPAGRPDPAPPDPR